MNEISYTLQKFIQMIEPSFFKVVTAALLSAGFFMFGSLYTQALVAIMMLMILDTLLALMAAYVNGEEITSRKFSRSLLKGIVYFTAISAGYFADLTIPFAVIQGTMVAFVGVTEFISILENVGLLGYATPKRLLNQLQKYKDSK